MTLAFSHRGGQPGGRLSWLGWPGLKVGREKLGRLRFQPFQCVQGMRLPPSWKAWVSAPRGS